MAHHDGDMPAIGAEIDTKIDRITRRYDVFRDRFTPYIGLAIGTTLVPTVPTGDWLVIAPAVVASAAWSTWFTVVRAPGHDEVRATRPRTGIVYVGGLLALMAVLVSQSPWFGFQALAGYVHSVGFLRGGWRWAALTVTSLLVAYTQSGMWQDPAAFLDPLGITAVTVIAAINMLISGGSTYLGYTVSLQSEQRRQMIAEANETNRRLEASLAENADLHAQLLSQARRTGALDERARLAREIHDAIAQGLTGVITQLEAAEVAEDDADARRRHVGIAQALARESLAEARRSVAGLAPGYLAEAQLPEAITRMAKGWARTTPIELVVDTTGDPRPLLPDLEVALFRVAQEALANVGRHAGASRAGLTLSYMDDTVVLDVRDDGAGFDPSARRERHGGSGFGLTAMEQRLRRVSGTLTVESAPGEGTALSASVPAIPAEVTA